MQYEEILCPGHKKTSVIKKKHCSLPNEWLGPNGQTKRQIGGTKRGKLLKEMFTAV